MASQQYAITGRKILPNTVAMINASTPYLPTMYRQKKEDEFAKAGLDLQGRSLDLQEKSITTNDELARQAFEQKKKQERLANLLGLGGLAVKGGLGAYQASEPVKEAVDKGITGVSNLFSGGATQQTGMEGGPSAALSYMGGDTHGGWSDIMSGGGGNLLTEGVTETVPKIADYLFGGGGSDILSSVASSGSPYADYLTDMMSFLQ